MARITVEDCLEKVENRFSLVLLVAKRSKQLLKGAMPTSTARTNKYVVNSLREVAAGKVYFDYGDETVVGTPEMQIQKDLNR